MPDDNFVMPDLALCESFTITATALDYRYEKWKPQEAHVVVNSCNQ